MAKKTTKKSVPLSKKPSLKKPLKAVIRTVKPTVSPKSTKATKATKEINKKRVSNPVPTKVEKKTRKPVPVLEAKPVPKLRLKEVAAKAVSVKVPAIKVSAVKVAAVQAPAAVVAVKRGRNPSGLNAKDIQRYRELLLTKRRELLGDVSSMEDEALRNSGGSNLSNLPIHMADMGTDNYEQEFTLGLVEKDRRILRDIHAALGKLQDGTFGICEATAQPISKERLEAQPWTRYSIEHARKLEQQRVRPV